MTRIGLFHSMYIIIAILFIHAFQIQPSKANSASEDSSQVISSRKSPSSSSSHRQLTTTPFTWDIQLETPGYFQNSPTISNDGMQHFVTKYSITNRDYNIQILKDDCITPTTGLPFLTTNEYQNATKPNTNQIEAIFVYNQSIIQSSNIWTSNTTGGEVNFCIRLSLYSDAEQGYEDGTPILFNFMETIYKIEVDMTTGFSSSIDLVQATPEYGGTDILYLDENITVYQCNDLFIELDPPPVLTQGDSLQICLEVQEDDESPSPFEVARIMDVSVTQDVKSYNYVKSFADTYWSRSECPALNTTESKCKVRMQLFGVYFLEEDPSDLVVSGVVKMDYLGRRHRHRRQLVESTMDHKMNSLDDVDKRKLEEEKTVGASAKFTLLISLSQATTTDITPSLPPAKIEGGETEIAGEEQEEEGYAPQGQGIEYDSKAGNVVFNIFSGMIIVLMSILAMNMTERFGDLTNY